LLASPLAGLYAAAAQTAAPSKITRIETVYWKSRDDAPFWPHWTWVKIDTDAGVSGIGETYPRNPAEAAVVHGCGRLAARPRPARYRAHLGRPLPPVSIFRSPAEPKFGP
jgi:L-alanine-DL-glutamate epimerase-like enolase superfamily enzyme